MAKPTVSKVFYGWPGRVGSGRVAQNSIVIRVYLLGIPVVNEVIFFYKNYYKIPLRGTNTIQYNTILAFVPVRVLVLVHVLVHVFVLVLVHVLVHVIVLVLVLFLVLVLVPVLVLVLVLVLLLVLVGVR